MPSLGLVCREKGVEGPDADIPRPICIVSHRILPYVRFGHVPLDLRPMGVLWRDGLPFGCS